MKRARKGTLSIEGRQVGREGEAASGVQAAEGSVLAYAGRGSKKEGGFCFIYAAAWLVGSSTQLTLR